MDPGAQVFPRLSSPSFCPTSHSKVGKAEAKAQKKEGPGPRTRGQCVLIRTQTLVRASHLGEWGNGKGGQRPCCGPHECFEESVKVWRASWLQAAGDTILWEPQ